jgi:hypothetical protein
MDAYWSWHQLNPGINVVTQDDAAADRCVFHIFGEEFFQAYTALPMVVMKTDIWRYAMLYAFGGVYSDIDVAAVQPLHRWLPPQPDGLDWPPNNDATIAPTWDDCNLITGLEVDVAFNQWVRLLCPSEMANTSIGSSISTSPQSAHSAVQTIASVAGHPILRQALLDFLKTAPTMRVVDGVLPDSLTGPGMLLQSFNQLVQSLDAKTMSVCNVGFWTEVIRFVLKSGNQTALQMFHSSWAAQNPTFESARRLKLCLMGRAMFQGQNAHHLFAALNFDSNSYASWYSDALAHVGNTKTSSQTH